MLFLEGGKREKLMKSLQVCLHARGFEGSSKANVRWVRELPFYFLWHNISGEASCLTGFPLGLVNANHKYASFIWLCRGGTFTSDFWTVRHIRFLCCNWLQIYLIVSRSLDLNLDCKRNTVGYSVVLPNHPAEIKRNQWSHNINSMICKSVPLRVYIILILDLNEFSFWAASPI